MTKQEQEWYRVFEKARRSLKAGLLCCAGFFASFMIPALLEERVELSGGWWLLCSSLAACFLIAIVIICATAPGKDKIEAAKEAEWAWLCKQEEQRLKEQAEVRKAEEEAERELVDETGLGVGNNLWEQIDAMKRGEG